MRCPDFSHGPGNSRLRSSRSPATPRNKRKSRADLATIDSGPALLPDVRIESAGARVLAGRPLQIGFERDAVTAGDVWLYDPETRVLAAGDLVTLPAPFFDTACPAHWQSALAELGDVDFDILVPGHGEPMSRADFAVYRRAFDALLACAASSCGATANAATAGNATPRSFLTTDWDKKLARALIDGYLDNGPEGRCGQACGPVRGHRVVTISARRRSP